MDHDCSHFAPSGADSSDDQLVSRLYELTQDSAANDGELETIDAMVHQRLLQTYGDDKTAPVAT